MTPSAPQALSQQEVLDRGWQLPGVRAMLLEQLTFTKKRRWWRGSCMLTYYLQRFGWYRWWVGGHWEQWSYVATNGYRFRQGSATHTSWMPTVLCYGMLDLPPNATDDPEVRLVRYTTLHFCEHYPYKGYWKVDTTR